MHSRKLEVSEKFNVTYSICTLVTDLNEYNEMVASFIQAGFEPEECEFIYADNTNGNEFEAYTAINRFLREAKGKYIIMCHQDIVLIDSKIKLEDCINNIEIVDPFWALLSNAGAVAPNYFSMLISYPGNKTVQKGIPPQKVISIDENFILVRSSANLSLSGDLKGFHMYGTDLCIISDILGYSAYSIPYNLMHKSEGSVSADFWEVKRKIQDKYNHKLKGRWMQTTITQFYISGSLFHRIFQGNIIVLILLKALNSIRKKRKS